MDDPSRYDGRASIFQIGERFEVYCSLVKEHSPGGLADPDFDWRGTFKPLDGGTSPSFGPARIEFPDGAAADIVIGGIEVSQPRFGEVRGVGRWPR